MSKKRERERNALSQSLHAILRRRAKELSAEYTEQYVSVFLRAADALEAADKFATDEQRAVLDAAGINRRLYSVLAEAHNVIQAPNKWKGWQDELLARIRLTLSATKKFGDGLRLLTVEIAKREPRESVEQKVRTLLDELYAAPEADETEDAAETVADASAQPEQAPTDAGDLPR